MTDKFQRICAKVDLDAVRHNVKNMKANLTPGTEIMAVVKADGYGHGAVPIARELEPLTEIAGFAVATAQEAFILRDARIKKPILVLGHTFPCSYERMIREEIRFTVFRYDTLEALSKITSDLAGEGTFKKARVHIKVDTGMSRIGVRADGEGLDFVKKALETEGILVEGIFTHMARADEEDKSAAKKQIALFSDFLRRIEEETGRRIPVRHCSNSAGILELPEADFDLVRAGIAIYGLWPSGEMKRDTVCLMPVLSLYSTIVYVKEIEAGTAVSYGGTFVAPERMRIATVPVGYGDGYPRGLSGKGFVLVCGKKAPILGRVCMDQLMIDVTDIPQALEGEQVTLIGRDGREQITMELLGDLSGRFHYEFACGLGKRVPRIYIKEGKVLSISDGCQDF
ncbi:alanine racemase [Parablautia muri]|uniref:Alanine racemase n=1 Tax=Parablautia muri TaxID=2320879 RepID=A0A9X5GRL3_9FIRM|nr:alanine racemase [Parablautia muri]NBJ92155.1 alanine racemase [Parablautia muri]